MPPAPAAECGATDESDSITAIRAEIVGDNFARAENIRATGHAPVLSLCRELLKAGFDPATPLEAYRSEMLCLRVRSIGEGAGLTVREGDGRPRLAKFEPWEAPQTRGGSSPMSLIDSPLLDSPLLTTDAPASAPGESA